MWGNKIQNHGASADRNPAIFCLSPSSSRILNLSAASWRLNYKSLGLDHVFIMKQRGVSSQAVSDFQSVGCLLKWGSNYNSVGFFAGI